MKKSSTKGRRPTKNVKSATLAALQPLSPHVIKSLTSGKTPVSGRIPVLGNTHTSRKNSGIASGAVSRGASGNETEFQFIDEELHVPVDDAVLFVRKRATREALSAARAAVVIVPEFGERIDDVNHQYISFALAQHYVTYLFDLPGHGGSTGSWSVANVRSCTNSIVDFARRSLPGARVLVLSSGMSAGVILSQELPSEKNRSLAIGAPFVGGSPDGMILLAPRYSSFKSPWALFQSLGACSAKGKERRRVINEFCSFSLPQVRTQIPTVVLEERMFGAVDALQRVQGRVHIRRSLPDVYSRGSVIERKRSLDDARVHIAHEILLSARLLLDDEKRFW